jgi:mRNA-degrading endonuclease toxin of MazEF toxin-antitoxin module
VICDRGDVIVVPFPFVDVAAEKRRPSVVLSHSAFNEANKHSVCAMITSAVRSQWRWDVAINDLVAAGLRHPCIIRWKLFTLPNERILKRLGNLSAADRAALTEATAEVLM